MNWSFRYEGFPDDLEVAIEWYRQSSKLLPDDRSQFELVASLLVAESSRAPLKSTMTIVARGDDHFADSLFAKGESGPKSILRTMFIEVTYR